MRPIQEVNRRQLLQVLAGAAATRLSAQQGAPAIVTSDRLRPVAAQGAMAGDVVPGRAMLWSRADRPARMHVEWATNEAFANPQRLTGPHCLDVSDYTGRVELTGLPADAVVHYRVRFSGLTHETALSEPVIGRFRTPPASQRDVSFAWTGDTVGQGYGINPEFGGMRLYETMRVRQPDFFIHSGDTIYADSPLQAELKLPDGRMWCNIVTEEKSKVAETLAEFRGNHRYNLMDANVRRFHAEVPQVWQWDDHEVTNNWSSSKDLTADARYREKSAALLVARGARAFLEYAPLRISPQESERVYRHIPYGPLLDVFVVDMRSYRGPNTHNRQATENEETPLLGAPQLEWLLDGLRRSKATWKVIAADMPIGLVVADGQDREGRPRFENGANGNGPASGRELETARLLAAMKRERIRNVVWVTADVHYTAAHFYDPVKARFTDFDPFWEFVAGPANAGTFGPNEIDDTFGIQVAFQKAPPKGQMNLSPLDGMQFFGETRIDGRSGELTVTLRDLAGAALYTKTLVPVRG